MMYEFNLNPFQSYILPHAIRDVPLSTLLMMPTYEKKESSLMYLSPKDFPYVRKNVALILCEMHSVRKSPKMSHSRLRAQRATFTF